MRCKLNPDLVVDAYAARYMSAFDPKHTGVDILSTYPWNGGTLQLLKTIHVEKSA